jgi:hypothetical protein
MGISRRQLLSLKEGETFGGTGDSPNAGKRASRRLGGGERSSLLAGHGATSQRHTAQFPTPHQPTRSLSSCEDLVRGRLSVSVLPPRSTASAPSCEQAVSRIDLYQVTVKKEARSLKKKEQRQDFYHHGPGMRRVLPYSTQ